MTRHPAWCECRSCLKVELAEQEAALAEASRVDDDPAVEAELGAYPHPVPTPLEDFAEWARTKMDGAEQAGAA